MAGGGRGGVASKACLRRAFDRIASCAVSRSVSQLAQRRQHLHSRARATLTSRISHAGPCAMSAEDAQVHHGRKGAPLPPRVRGAWHAPYRPYGRGQARKYGGGGGGGPNPRPSAPPALAFARPPPHIGPTRPHVRSSAGPSTHPLPARPMPVARPQNPPGTAEPSLVSSLAGSTSRPALPRAPSLDIIDLTGDVPSPRQAPHAQIRHTLPAPRQCVHPRRSVRCTPDVHLALSLGNLEEATRWPLHACSFATDSAGSSRADAFRHPTQTASTRRSSERQPPQVIQPRQDTRSSQHD
jgi:hypothetical protein